MTAAFDAVVFAGALHEPLSRRLAVVRQRLLSEVVDVYARLSDDELLLRLSERLG